MIFGFIFLGLIGISLIGLAMHLSRRPIRCCDDALHERLTSTGMSRMFILTTLMLLGLYLLIKVWSIRILPLCMRLYFTYALTDASLGLTRFLMYRNLSIDMELQPLFKVRRLLTVYKADFIGILIAIPIDLCYWSTDNWLISNILAAVVALHLMLYIRFTSLGYSSILLMAFFVYDVFFVFYTPVMTTVATSINIPIKLVWPRSLTNFTLLGSAQEKDRYSFLGLGDIVIPGLYLTLLVRMEETLKIAPESLSRPFCVARRGLFAYGLALVTTVSSLLFMKVAQPALLYIVPAILSTVYGSIWIKHTTADRKAIFKYDEDRLSIRPFRQGTSSGSDSAPNRPAESHQE
ncbi:Signal peptide peptidase [Giardia muris]|uniref:Signal peptide peptidase n=1 Tax=Giardia muris TaxID=5742 RepID=A0A4Z1TCV9_GIAMU|nr:Signal peptide peptidase [Giardia muris]|eukprot:TNJ30341.1 Signal peptide peptidase [Giardia muris]